MSEERQIQNLALVGFMGAGKSSVGRLVAKQLRFDFLDTDALIETRTGRRISSIFAEAGEGAFRKHERQVLDNLRNATNTVIATGGGMVANDQNLASLKEHALVVCLWASAETIWERVASQTHRPLLQDPDPLTRIRQLLQEREPFYREADVLVNTERRSVKEVAHQIVHQFYLAQKGSFQA
ncbi:MAG: shikimate kinase [Limisphaerales bacterium]